MFIFKDGNLEMKKKIKIMYEMYKNNTNESFEFEVLGMKLKTLFSFVINDLSFSMLFDEI